jgi:N-acetylmuramidase/Putative peptidoglycan binding domain
MSGGFAGTGTPLAEAEWAATLAALGCEETALWAILDQEAGGFGFLPDRRPKILFERVWFHQRTGGRFDGVDTNISSADPGGYWGGAAEYARLERALALDETAALESTSWGLGQVMGAHATGLGYADVAAMVRATVAAEGAQLRMVQAFIAAWPALHEALRARDWGRIAFYYNGAGYRRNHYDTLLARRAAMLAEPGLLPRFDVRSAQVALNYLGYLQGGVDGVWGPRTRAAVAAFRIDEGMDAGGPDLDAETARLLRARAQL